MAGCQHPHRSPRHPIEESRLGRRDPGAAVATDEALTREGRDHESEQRNVSGKWNVNHVSLPRLAGNRSGVVGQTSQQAQLAAPAGARRQPQRDDSGISRESNSTLAGRALANEQRGAIEEACDRAHLGGKAPEGLPAPRRVHPALFGGDHQETRGVAVGRRAQASNSDGRHARTAPARTSSDNRPRNGVR